MDALATELKLKAEKYLESDEQLCGEEIPVLIADFVIEQFRLQRNYPGHFSEKRIMEDMLRHKSTLVMMTVDCFSHYGAEGETSHQEKNISRNYENAYVSKSLLNSITPYVGVF